MTLGMLMDVLKKANDYICRIAENKPLTEEDYHKIGDIMAVMYRFISNTEINDD